MGGMQEYCSSHEKVAAEGWQSVIEPLVLELWGAPIGADVQLVVDTNGRRIWYDNLTGQPAVLSDQAK